MILQLGVAIAMQGSRKMRELCKAPHVFISAHGG